MADLSGLDGYVLETIDGKAVESVGDQVVRIGGVWVWGVPIPGPHGPMLVRCDKCQSSAARCFLSGEGYVYGKHDACGWGMYKKITDEWRVEWEKRNARPGPIFKECV